MGYSSDLLNEKKKKLTLVSEEYEERNIAPTIEKMFCNYYTPQVPSAAQEKKLNRILIEAKTEGKLISSENPILVFTGQNSFLISTSLLR